MPPPDRRNPDEIDTAFRDLVNQRLDDGSMKMKRLAEALKVNTDATQRIEQNTQEIVDFFNTLKSTVKVLNFLAMLAKPLTAIIVFCTATWGAIALLIKRGT